MKGYQLTFFTQQGRMVEKVPLADWLILQASELEIHGATVTTGVQGVGHDGKAHTTNLFDISDQPVQITFIVDEQQAARLVERLDGSGAEDVFFVRSIVEFGRVGA